MSDQKKPPAKDLGDLRARLGLSQPAPAAASPTPPEGQGGEEESTEMVEALDDAEAIEIDEATDVVSEEAAPAGSPAGPLQPPPPSSDPDAAPAPAAPAPAAPAVAASLASPLADLPGPGPLKMPPPEMTEGSMGMGDATMAAFAPVQRSGRKTVVGGIVAASLISLGFGYMAGKINKDRIIINKQIQDAERCRVVVKRTVRKIKDLLPLLKKSAPGTPDFVLAEKLATYDGKLAIEELMTDNLLLGPRASSDLLQFSYLANRLYELGRNHGRLTMKTHKAALEELVKGGAAMTSTKPLFVYHRKRVGLEPPPSMLVTMEGKPEKRGKLWIMPVKSLTGQSHDAEVKRLVGLDRRQLLGASGPNVMEMYVTRMGELQRVAALLDTTMDLLVNKLERQASQEPLFYL